MSEEYLVFAEVKGNLPELSCRGKTLRVLKLTVDSVNFGLCNYLDYFACPLMIQKKYDILTFKEGSCLSIVLLIV